MTLRVGWLVVWVAWLSPAQSTKCAPVEGDRIEARSLAVFLPAFRALPPDTPISLAPAPGARRTFRDSELAALARRHSLELADYPESVCFEWEMQPLDRAQVMEAMRVVLPAPDLAIEIVELSLYSVPSGRLEFRRDGLGMPADPIAAAPVVWRGAVVYGEGRRYSVWARVRLRAKVTRVVAADALKRGAPIQPSQLRTETVEAFPMTGDAAESVEQAAGKAPWRDIAPNTVVRLSSLMQLPDVARGELVEVEVRAGAARLALSAKAESAGRNGETISVRNLSTNRVFPARVSGKKRVVVDLEPKNGN